MIVKPTSQSVSGKESAQLIRVSAGLIGETLVGEIFLFFSNFLETTRDF